MHPPMRFRVPTSSLARRDFIKTMVATPLILSGSELLAATPSEVASTVRHLAQVTRAEYHDEQLSVAISDRLLAALAEGRLQSTSPGQLAGKLNTEIEVASNDAHFVVMAGDMTGMRNVPPTEPHRPTAPLNEAELRFLQGENFGIAEAEVLAGNVGRIAIRPQFYRPAPEVCQRVAVAMTVLSDTDGLVVDLTETIGGDPKSVAHFLSYFFDRPPFVVNRFKWRNLPVEEYWTTAEPGGPKYGEKRPVAVLVSGSSFSAAEEFAYDIQALGRGIVVGQKTPGAANHALPVALAGGFTVFIPKARAENPLTGTNWEGVGVRPSIEIKPPTIEAARKVVLARIAALESKAMPRTVEPRGARQ